MNYQRIILVLISLVALFFLISHIRSFADTSTYQDIKIVKPTMAPTLTPTLTPTPTPPFPVQFVIPKLGIDTAVEPVETDTIGTMQLPQETDKVGWYYRGYKPGENGNAVIGGHFDLVTGAPAVFYNLKALAIGDTIEVVDGYGIRRIFKVTYIQSYLYDEIPVESIFGKSDMAHLNIITCSGVFNQDKHNYSHRLVVYSDILH